MTRDHRGRSIQGYLTMGLGAVIVLAIPLTVRHFDRSADEFSVHRFAFSTAIGWIACAVMISVVATRQLQLLLKFEMGPSLALAYDALPILLLPAWLVLGLAAFTGHWLLAIVAAALCVAHLTLVVPRLVASRVPRWAKRAPRFVLVVANVYVDNKEPADSARQLAMSPADVVVVIESTPSFMSLFDEAGGDSAFPHRISDPSDRSDYAVTVVARHHLGPRSAMTTLGPLHLAVAEVQVDGIGILVIGLNPTATVDVGGLHTWKEQIDALTDYIPTLDGPFIITGDMNATHYRPEFEELLTLGLSDAIDSLGAGLKPSFKLSADGLLGSIGGVVRLDQALVNERLHALSIENLEPCGSDHLPFTLTLAVRPGQLASAAVDRA